MVSLFNPTFGNTRCGMAFPSSAEDRTDDRCLVFLHIPKTAGQTLHFMTLRNYPQHETIHLNILDKPLDAEMERIPLEERSRARLLWGHMPYGAHKHMPRRMFVTPVHDLEVWPFSERPLPWCEWWDPSWFTESRAGP